MIVVDTNIVLSLIMEDNVINDKLFENHTILAPSYFKMEVWNVLRKYHFFNHVPIDVIDESYKSIVMLIDQFEDDSFLLNSAKKISFNLNHPIYDCLFLALALDKNAIFASFDKKLVEKAKHIGIETLEEFSGQNYI